MPRIHVVESEMRDRTFRAHIKAACEMNGGVTQKEIAKRIGIEPSTFCIKLKRPGTFRLNEIYRICSMLHISPSELIEPKEE